MAHYQSDNAYYLSSAEANIQTYLTAVDPNPNVIGFGSFSVVPYGAMVGPYPKSMTAEPFPSADVTVLAPQSVSPDVDVINFVFNNSTHQSSGISDIAETLPPKPLLTLKSTNPAQHRGEWHYTGALDFVSRLKSGGWAAGYPLGNIYPVNAAAPIGTVPLTIWAAAGGEYYLSTNSSAPVDADAQGAIWSQLPSNFSPAGYVWPSNAANTQQPYNPATTWLVPVYCALTNVLDGADGSHPIFVYNSDASTYNSLIGLGYKSCAGTTNGVAFRVLPYSADLHKNVPILPGNGLALLAPLAPSPPNPDYAVQTFGIALDANYIDAYSNTASLTTTTAGPKIYLDPQDRLIVSPGGGVIPTTISGPTQTTICSTNVTYAAANSGSITIPVDLCSGALAPGGILGIWSDDLTSGTNGGPPYSTVSSVFSTPSGVPGGILAVSPNYPFLEMIDCSDNLRWTSPTTSNGTATSFPPRNDLLCFPSITYTAPVPLP